MAWTAAARRRWNTPWKPRSALTPSCTRFSSKMTKPMTEGAAAAEGDSGASPASVVRAEAGEWDGVAVEVEDTRRRVVLTAGKYSSKFPKKRAAVYSKFLRSNRSIRFISRSKKIGRAHV